MKKSIYLSIAAGIIVGSSALMADTGVVIHEKNGNATFYPSENLEYVEFVGEDYTPGDQVKLTSNIKDLAVNITLRATAVVTAQSAVGLILTDNAGSILYYNTKVELAKFPIGSVVDVEGTVVYYGTGFQFDSSASLTVIGEKNYTYPIPTAYNVAKVNEAAANKDFVLATYVTLEGELNINGNYNNIKLPGTSYIGSFYAPADNLKSKIVNGQTYKYTGYYTGMVSNKYFYMVLTDVTLIEDDNDGPAPDNTLQQYDGYKYPLSYVALPQGTPQQVKEYTGFTVNFNKDNHTANYVCWELLSSETNGSEDRNKYKYWVDYDLEGCLDTDLDYATYSYERGHLCPAADQRWSSSAMYDSMVMSNMCPQLRSLNSGIWGTLESKERDWANRDGAIWIVAGPIYYATDTLYLGKSKERVPSGYFKAFLYYNGKFSRAIGFAFQNGSNPGNLEDYAMSIDDLERELGYDLFPALPDELENEIEATYSFADWNK